ncbi:MAG: helix-turn-helix domain-containing protein [Armatimonadia bacterium]
MKEDSIAPEVLMTPQEVADILRLNVQTVYAMLRDGRMPHHLLGRNYRVSRAQLAEYLKSTAKGSKK